MCLVRSPSGLTSNIPSTHRAERTEQRVHMCHARCFQPSPPLLQDGGGCGIHRHIVHLRCHINKHTYKDISRRTGSSSICTPRLPKEPEQTTRRWNLNDLLIIQSNSCSFTSRWTNCSITLAPFLACVSLPGERTRTCEAKKKHSPPKDTRYCQHNAALPK